MRFQDWPRYRLFGLTLGSDFPFASRLGAGDGIPDVTFTCTAEPPLSGGWESRAPVYASPERMADGRNITCLYRLADGDVLRLTGLADYYVWAERIVCHLWDPACDYMAEIHLLGSVLSFWFERQGVPALHVSAVEVDGRAVGFLSSNGGGKSSLAAAFMQAGHALLTDDVLPIRRLGERFFGFPGYPQMRLWPDEAQHFLGHYEDLGRVHPAFSKRRVPVGDGGFGAFRDAALPLACFYLPQRQDSAADGGRTRIVPIPPRDAVMEMVRHSFTPRLAEALGRQAERLDLFAALVRQVPVRRLLYPSGLAHLPYVREAILEDLANMP